MKRRTIASLLVTTMVVSMLVSGCGNTNKDTEKNSEVVTERETETENVSEGIESEKDTQVSTNDSETEVSESEKVDENNSGNKDDSDKSSEEATKPSEPEKPVHTCNFATLKTDANNHWYACSCGATSGKGAHGYSDDYDSSCNTCGYTRSVPEKPVEPSKPGSSVNWNGGNITLDSIGVKIPTLTEFNKTGLESAGNDWWWTGSENDKQALSAMNQIYKTCEDFFGGLVSLGAGTQGTNAFSVTQNAIWFSYTDGMKQEFCLSRDANNGYYVLTINRSLKEDIFYNGADISDINRDVVRTLCSFVSSKPNELYNYIYTGLHEDAKVLNTSVYKSVGDCQVKFGKESYVNGDNWHCVFYIKGK